MFRVGRAPVVGSTPRRRWADGNKAGCGVALCGACHRASRRTSNSVLHHAGGERRRQVDHDHRSDRRHIKRQNPGSLAWYRGGPVRLLPILVRSCRRRRSSKETRTPPTKLMRPCPAISAAAAPTRASGLLSNTLHNPLESGLEGVVMGLARLLNPTNDRKDGFSTGISQRAFLVTSAAAGGGMLVGFYLPG